MLDNQVGAAGFEPAAPCSQSRYANRTALRPELMTLKTTKISGLLPAMSTVGGIRRMPPSGEGGIRTPGTCYGTHV